MNTKPVGRVQHSGPLGFAPKKVERIEIWQGGRLVGYEYTKPDKKNCWLEGVK